MILTPKQITTMLKGEFKNAQVFLTDGTYVTPKKSWIVGDFFRMFRSNLSANGLFGWKKYHDCDNKAFRLWQFAGDCHAKTMEVRKLKGQDVFEGITVGVFFFKQNTNFGHAINFIITDQGMEFLEPQNGEIVTLTQEEKDSAWFAIF